VHHSLFVAAQVVGEVLILLKRLSDTRDVAVSKNAEAAGEEWALDSVPLHILIFEEPDGGLGRRDSTPGSQNRLLEGRPIPGLRIGGAKENAGAALAAPAAL
jgi:hypothetical protein